MLTAPIIIVDDDVDDIDLFREAATELNIPNPVLSFPSGDQLVKYLNDAGQVPVFILCDVNIPGDDGFKIRHQLLSNGNSYLKNIPFLFWSTSALDLQVLKSFEVMAHGFFRKPASFTELSSLLMCIYTYWNTCIHIKG